MQTDSRATAPQAAPTASTADDVLIVGAGPAGLALACALSDLGLRCRLFERQTAEQLANPAPDGRDIALTHRSLDILQHLGLWQRIPSTEIAPIRTAQVRDGESPRFLNFDASRAGHAALGYLVPNHEIRRAVHAGAASRDGITLMAGVEVSQVRRAEGSSAPSVQLADGRRYSAPLLVAADSRFSAARRQLGIGANSRDFGRTVIVCRMRHERDHAAVAHECFRYGGTLALLPMNNQQVSAVLTVSADKAARLMALEPAEFTAHVECESEHRLGRMELVGQRHAYPLVAVYAHHFMAPGAALIGDTAVGMHPVTAHGYNFGLYGIDTLSGLIAKARQQGRPIADETLLRTFETEHRRATLPIYLGTNAIVTLFTDDRPLPRLLRHAVLRVADHLPPLQQAITHQLTGRGRPAWPLTLLSHRTD